MDYAQISGLYGKNMVESIILFREIALEIHNDPDTINQYKMTKTMMDLCNDRNSSCLLRTKLYEALSYGDVGVLLASPGPSLAGLMLRELGNEEQKSYFFDYVETRQSSAFLAVTEPRFGSDAANMEARLIKQSDGSYLLNAEKWLVGHGADASIGVLVAKISDGPLGMVAILLTPEILEAHYNKHNNYRHHLNTFGLKGARLSRLVFNNFIVPKENVLGSHLKLVDRGMMALIKTFNRMRPCVASFALGQAQATVDYAIYNKSNLTPIQENQIQYLNFELTTVRDILYKAASIVDSHPIETALVSLAKVKATQINEKVTREISQIFGLEIFGHPLLLKWSQDTNGYEYMEGTTNMQFKNVYQGYLRKAFNKL